LYLKRPFYYADGQHRYSTSYGALQHYKFSATTVRTGNLRRIIAGHKKIWPFHERRQRDGGGQGADERGRRRNNRRSYICWVCEYVIAGIPLGYENPSQNILILSICLFRFRLSSYAYIANADGGLELFLQVTRSSANFSRAHLHRIYRGGLNNVKLWK